MDSYVTSESDDKNVYSSDQDEYEYERSRSNSPMNFIQTESSHTSHNSQRSYGRGEDFVLESGYTETNDTSETSTSFLRNISIRQEISSSKKPTASNNSNAMKAIGLAIILIVLAIIFNIWNPTETTITPKIVCSQFKELPKHFSSQDINLWKSLKIGIEKMLNSNPTSPSIFLLAYDDIETAQNVMKMVLEATASCMNSTNPIQLDGRTFVTDAMLEDYGNIIAEYKEQLENDGIMYVSDLNQMPIKAAQVFHTICDTITPLVKRAVIFFTVRLNRNERNLSPRAISELVESELKTNWFRDSKISEDTLNALIARVTDQVFLLKSEK